MALCIIAWLLLAVQGERERQARRMPRAACWMGASLAPLLLAVAVQQ